MMLILMILINTGLKTKKKKADDLFSEISARPSMMS